MVKFFSRIVIFRALGWFCEILIFSLIKMIIRLSVSLQILRLQECLSKYERSGDGMAPQVVNTFINFMAFSKLANSNFHVR